MFASFLDGSVLASENMPPTLPRLPDISVTQVPAECEVQAGSAAFGSWTWVTALGVGVGLGSVIARGLAVGDRLGSPGSRFADALIQRQEDQESCVEVSCRDSGPRT
jgi:hypothetical protein